MSATPGFAVIYRWRLHEGRESQFGDAWKRITLLIASQRGGLGSRLHRAEDRSWLAYARWPDKATWEKSRESGPVDVEASRLMLEAIAESLPPILLSPVADLPGHTGDG